MVWIYQYVLRLVQIHYQNPKKDIGKVGAIILVKNNSEQLNKKIFELKLALLSTKG